MPTTAQSYTYSIQGIHCSLCLKKLKSLPESTQSLQNVSIDMGRHMLKAQVEVGFSSKKFIEKIQDLGFEAKEIHLDEQKQAKLKKHSRSLLARVGIAGALAGNIMLLSYSIYLGAPKHFHNLFSWISGGLYLPILLFAATPIFKNSWLSLKRKEASIDLPLALAILVGSTLSYYNLAISSSAIYFDSLAALVFLLLGSRYIVSRFQERYITPVEVQDLFSQTHYLRVMAGTPRPVLVSDIKPGDQIIVKQGEVIPVDGVLRLKSAYVDNSLMTGESDPVELKEWGSIFAGAVCLDNEILVEATSTQNASRAQKLFERLNIALEKDSRLIQLTDRFAKLFTYAVVGVGLAFFSVYAFIDLPVAINRVLALFVIACPCALAVTTPLILRLALKKVLANKVMVKSTEAFETIAKSKQVVFDKTGTLTIGSNQPGVWSQKPNQEQANIIYSLERNSQHPIAKQILRSLKGFDLSEAVYSDFQETAGQGVSANFGNYRYSLKSSKQVSGAVGLYKNGIESLSFLPSSSLRHEVPEQIKKLKGLGMELFLLTGDKVERAHDVAIRSGIPIENVYAEVTPETKTEVIEQLNSIGPVIFVGDGMNDSLAMAHAGLGISMQQSVESTFAASQVHFLDKGIEGLYQLFLFSRKTVNTIKLLLLISLIYNLSFGALALSGFITPLVAAILMPISSILLLTVGVLMLQRRSL